MMLVPPYITAELCDIVEHALVEHLSPEECAEWVVYNAPLLERFKDLTSGHTQTQLIALGFLLASIWVRIVMAEEEKDNALPTMPEPTN